MYNQCPTAIIAAREDEALTHGQVLYGLVKPTKKMDQVESTAAMVNVIPKQRIYIMESPEEINLFLSELNKRPLVLQPSAYIGRGVAAIGCTFCTNEERWIIVVNQAHPKIRGRIEMGVETARAKMARGEPFVIKLSFNHYLKRIYLDTMTRTALDPRFTYIDFEDAEIVIRYPGDVFHRRNPLLIDLKKSEIHFSFEDLLPNELSRRTVGAAQSEWKSPALRVVMPDELLQLLPGWNFEMIDPLEGVTSPEDEGAVGGMDMSEEVDTQDPPSGRVMGRAQRKGKSAGQKHHVPVELHVPDANGPQILHTGNVPPSLSGPPMMKTPSPQSRPYEDLNRGLYANEHAYEQKRVHNSSASPQPHHRMEAPYEEMNMQRQHLSAPHSPTASQNYAPRTPTTPRTPGGPRTPSAQMSPKSVPHHSPYSPHTPHSPSYGKNVNGYNEDVVRDGHNKPSRQTYLTDDDENDGGFSSRSKGQQSQQKYDSNFNKSAEVDRYGNQSNPSDRYADQSSPSNFKLDQTRPVPPQRRNFPQSSRPVVSPRGLHHHQGSGRSDTSASDSGFGESDESAKYRNDKNNSQSNRQYTPSKAPYYNHAFQQESPDKDKSVVDDIMAKHKAMAAQMLHTGQPTSPSMTQSRYNKHEFYTDDKYGRQVQELRQNINNLEEACDVPQSDFSRTRLRMNSNREEPVEESFI